MLLKDSVPLEVFAQLIHYQRFVLQSHVLIEIECAVAMHAEWVRFRVAVDATRHTFRQLTRWIIRNTQIRHPFSIVINRRAGLSIERSIANRSLLELGIRNTTHDDLDSVQAIVRVRQMEERWIGHGVAKKEYWHSGHPIDTSD